MSVGVRPVMTGPKRRDGGAGCLAVHVSKLR